MRRKTKIDLFLIICNSSFTGGCLRAPSRLSSRATSGDASVGGNTRGIFGIDMLDTYWPIRSLWWCLRCFLWWWVPLRHHQRWRGRTRLVDWERPINALLSAVELHVRCEACLRNKLRECYAKNAVCSPVFQSFLALFAYADKAEYGNRSFFMNIYMRIMSFSNSALMDTLTLYFHLCNVYTYSHLHMYVCTI